MDFQGSLDAFERDPAADLGSGGPAPGAGELRHGAERLEGFDAGPVRALLPGLRLSGRIGPASVFAERHGRRRADHRLDAAHREASDRAADQGRLLGLRSDSRRAHGLAHSRVDRETPNRRLFRADGRPPADVDAATGRRGRRPIGCRLAQRPFARLHARAAGEARSAAVGHRSAKPLRHGRSAARGARPPRRAASLLRAIGRNDPRHGLPGATALGEYVEPIVAASRLLRGTARRGAVGVAAKSEGAVFVGRRWLGDGPHPNPLPTQPSVGARRGEESGGSPSRPLTGCGRAWRRTADDERAGPRLRPSPAARSLRPGRGRGESARRAGGQRSRRGPDGHRESRGRFRRVARRSIPWSAPG